MLARDLCDCSNTNVARSIQICNLTRCLAHYRNMRTQKYLRFEVFTAVTMKNGVFWDVTPCGSCKNRRFGGFEMQQGEDLHNEGNRPIAVGTVMSTYKNMAVRCN
jgi:hypothetical protein